MNLEEIKKRIIPVLNKYKIKRAGIFGSYARAGEEHPGDLDLLVELESHTGLLEFVGIKLELEEALNMKVDLVEYNALKPDLRTRILNEAIEII